jgi:hypothetical protein
MPNNKKRQVVSDSTSDDSFPIYDSRSEPNATSNEEIVDISESGDENQDNGDSQNGLDVASAKNSNAELEPIEWKFIRKLAEDKFYETKKKNVAEISEKIISKIDAKLKNEAGGLDDTSLQEDLLDDEDKDDRCRVCGHVMNLPDYSLSEHEEVSAFFFFNFSFD